MPAHATRVLTAHVTAQLAIQVDHITAPLYLSRG